MVRESQILLSTVIALVFIGIFLVYSASAVDANVTERLIRQLVYVSLGFAAMFTMAHFDYRRLADPFISRGLVALALFLLIAVLVPGIGVVRGGAQRWIEIAGFTFQPSEFAKFALIVLLAKKLAQNQDRLGEFWKGFMPPVVITTLFAGLVLLEKDLGGPVVMCIVAFIMLFLAGVRWRHLIPSVAPFLGALYIFSITSPHRVKRLMAFLDPWRYRDDEGYQLIQSMAAFAQGAIWGRGPGAGEQKLYYLPEAHSDFIFAVWAEEMGLVGTAILVALFATLLIVALRVALCASDLFGALLAGGIISLVATQSVINMAVTTGMLPTKGLTLPFISWGGSSLIVLMALMGIVISVALYAVEPEGRRAPVSA